jgi:long-subunit fatty acid transport protein
MYSSSSKFYGFTILFFLLSIFNLKAQNINDALRLSTSGLGSNARALGMGNSYIALSDDASAAFFNPAGFGFLKRLEFSGGFEYVNYNNEAEFLGNTIDHSNSSTRLNRISFAFPFPTVRGSLVFALSYHKTKDLTGALKFNGFNTGPTSMIQDLNVDTNIPFDLYLTDDDYNTPIAGNLNQMGDILSSGSINNWTFSGAIEVYKNIFIGGNLNIISGSFESNNDYYEDDTRNIYQNRLYPADSVHSDFQTFYLNRLLKWDIAGVDAKLGMIYQFNPNSRFGFTVQFPRTYTIKEDFIVEGRSEFGSGPIENLVSEDYSDAVEYDIISPFEFAGGFSLNFAGLIFAAEATLVNYNQIEFDNPDGLEESYIQRINKEIKDQLEAVINYNLGLEYTIPAIGLRVRGGYLVKPSAYKDDPSKFDRKYITAGIGFLADNTIGVDLAYAHGMWDDFGDNYGSNVSRTNQKIASDHFILTGIYRF